jgi:serine/threonine protein kinase/cyclophilin family peptidyl-prolyl cis-trans isomerase
VSEGDFGRYRLQELLGEGGMGQVYRAFDTETDRIVALKLLPPHLIKDHEFERRFRREAQIAASLNDPHIVPIHHYGEIDGRLYVDMRLIAGRDLGQLLKGDNGLPPERAVAYVEQLAEGLHAAHKAGLVHRDVKPSNVLVTDRDFVYLIDFGIAQSEGQTRMTGTGLAIGTFAYMAPERMNSGSADSRSDVYALACVLHECLTGKPPFPGNSVEQLVAAHLMTEPPQPSTQRTGISASFDSVVNRGMAKDPAARYQTTLELAAAAREALTSAGGPNRIGAATPEKEVPADVWSLPSAATNTRVPSSVPQWGPPGAANETRRVAATFGWQQHLEIAEAQRRRRQYTVAGIAAAIVLCVAAVAIVLVVTGNERSPASTPTVASRSSSVAAAPPTTDQSPANPPPPGTGQLPAFAPPADLGANCQYPAAEAASKTNTPPRAGKVPTDPAQISASMVTSQGSIGLQLDNAKAPCTVNSFVSLAQQGFFNDTSCHRLTSSPTLSVLQCGDPTASGTGGPGYEFANEYPTDQYPPDSPQLQQPVTYPRGTLAMANAGPGTNGSQFFLVYRDSQLPPNYTAFGTIDATGLSTLDKIAAAGVADASQDGKPTVDVQIKSIQLD